ncbi:MAG TPA: urate hydroxylase PuuD [Gammaproteobacteria bacterium]|nr:urate hydroxylase PuuD [Gammaproteobacteria bacterium]
MNPLKSITGTIVTGIVIAAIVMGIFSDGNTAAIEWTVWFHVLAGVAWIGLLYYFNFVQVPAVAKALSEAEGGGPGPAAINKYIAPPALLWFRWAALATWLSGAAILMKMGILGAAFGLQGGAAVIGVGAWLGTIMLFNVWVLIWPNQKKILGLDGKEHSADTIASAKFVALMASRTNTALSIPMLLSMTAFGHGGFPF